MIKEGLKAAGSIAKASKSKNALDVMRVVGDSAKVVGKIAKGKEKSKKKSGKR